MSGMTVTPRLRIADGRAGLPGPGTLGGRDGRSFAGGGGRAGERRRAVVRRPGRGVPSFGPVTMTPRTQCGSLNGRFEREESFEC